MDTGNCERCKGPNNGARLCIRCDDWETVLGRLERLLDGAEDKRLFRWAIRPIASIAGMEERLPEDKRYLIVL